jgi:hypothetical protein
VQHLHRLLSNASVEDVQVSRERQRYNSVRRTPHVSHLLVGKTSPEGIRCRRLASFYVPWPRQRQLRGKYAIMFLTYTASRWYRPNKSRWHCYQGSNLTHTMTSDRHATEFSGHGRGQRLADSRRCLYGSQRIRPDYRPPCRHTERPSRPIRRSQSGLHLAHTARPRRTWCAS